jgi:hypothetical protein
MHYEGKSHEKRARNFLQCWAIENKVTISSKKNSLNPTLENQLNCEFSFQFKVDINYPYSHKLWVELQLKCS